MRTVYTAIWYDPAKCEAKAIKAGWDATSGDGFLDIYHPEEDPGGHDEKDFTDLDKAVAHLQKIVSTDKDFWGTGRINQYEVDGKRCKYCTCRGWNCVHTYLVDETGIIEHAAEDNCCEDGD